MAGSTLKRIARKLLHWARRPRGLVAMRRGRIASLTPLSTAYGFDRGTPVDRLYIERFLAAHSADIRGSVLEVTDDTYSRRFGGARVTGQQVLHRGAGNARATITGDLADPATLPAAAFDCIILTQTLQYVFDLAAAAANLRRALKPGGVLLVTVPAVTPVLASYWGDAHYWLFTKASLERVLAGAFEPGGLSVSSFGNLHAATAFLHGAAVEDVQRSRLDPVQDAYAVIIAARAVAR